MGVVPKSIVEIRDFKGMASNYDPNDITPGTSQEQININGLQRGQLEVRRGMRQLTFEESPTALPTWTNPDQKLPGIDKFPVLWMRADRGVTKDESDVVSAWDSAEGNSYSFAQATADNRPTWVANAINGRPAIQFDGTDDLLFISQGIMDSSEGLVIVVIKLTDATTLQYFLAQADDTDPSELMAIGKREDSANKYGIIHRDGSVTQKVGGGTDATTNAVAVRYMTEGTRYAIAIDTVEETIVADAEDDDGDWWTEANASTHDFTSIGALKFSAGEFNHMDGQLAEILVYDEEPSAAGIALLDGYIQDRYSL